MNSLPAKPLPCNQKWDDMIPCGKNGRVCLGCGKVVTDFRSFKMKEIVKTHLGSPIPVCGIYTEKQLNEWGQKKNNTRYVKIFSISSVLIALSHLLQGETLSQTKSMQSVAIADSTKSQKPVHHKKPIRYISGSVIQLKSDSVKWPIKGASIVLQNDSSFHTKTDSLGRFKINISRKFISLPDTLTLFVSHPDYLSQSILLNKKNPASLEIVFSEFKVEGGRIPLIDIYTKPSYFYAISPLDEKQDTSKNKKWWQKKKK